MLPNEVRTVEKKSPAPAEPIHFSRGNLLGIYKQNVALKLFSNASMSSPFEVINNCLVGDIRVTLLPGFLRV